MLIKSIFGGKSEVIEASAKKCPVVLMTRIRLARNLADVPFPGWAKESRKREVLETCLPAVASLPQMKRGISAEIHSLSDLEREILVERHLISRELSSHAEEAGVVISKDQSISVMINEEDHLRIQVIKSGYRFKQAWGVIDGLDTALEDQLDFAFSEKVGYLTACPTNLGTGMRASAMMHLPALVISSQMEKVVRAVNQLGIAVRGLFGEGSDASGSIFQISNQTTLGESEEEIIKRLSAVLRTIIDQEMNAREKILEKDPNKLFDKIGRAYGILQNSHLLTSSECMNLASLVRFGVDLEMFPEKTRNVVDRMFIECQPGHVKYHAGNDIDSGARDAFRAQYMRRQFEHVERPLFNLHQTTSPDDTPETDPEKETN
ncbi:protein arginine kinase [Pelagicoccus sp. SDUM812003]|uniref:protein arginine kinase n=1 Tax=Pelagicoccus sp. SDUM812003 TaxID=3041267 RepID=UPI00280C4489|nr:protein arginine kinase [Pelagicoccus sp. SDUM812003]MDQ8202117.1 protein arginine kinase [Pelagicoccus sp. SDUM812003]